jgi:hypothetical protein
MAGTRRGSYQWQRWESGSDDEVNNSFLDHSRDRHVILVRSKNFRLWDIDLSMEFWERFTAIRRTNWRTDNVCWRETMNFIISSKLTNLESETHSDRNENHSEVVDSDWRFPYLRQQERDMVIKLWNFDEKEKIVFRYSIPMICHPWESK